MEFLKKKGLGILVCGLIAGISTFLGSLSIGNFSLEVIGAPVFAILMGMIITLIVPTFATNKNMAGGIKFTSKKILQWAVIILGFTLNLGTIAKVGSKSLPVIISTITISLLTAMLMMKILKADKKVSCLIGVGSSICGGSAIAATAPVIDADDEEVAQSISVIFLFNVLAALIFPSLGKAIGLGSEGFAIFAGTAVNDTSSVTAAASTAEGIYGVEGILSAAVTVKLTRTLAIIPITLILAFIRTHRAKKNGGNGSSVDFKKIFPWFILFFVGAAIITTIVSAMPASSFTDFYSTGFVKAMKWLAKFFIAMAMCAIGLNTNIVNLIKKGGKPILMGFCCWVAITLVSIGVQMLTGIYYTNI
ncbi:MAG: YeiH family protein [Lachnospiraceae bacterium]